MRQTARLRGLAARALLAATLAAAAAPHRHAGLAEEPVSGKGASNVLTAHDPSSKALHWHAVLKVIQQDPCWACHRHRYAGLVAAEVLSRSLPTGGAPVALPYRSADSVARFTRLSRGPPSVL